MKVAIGSDHAGFELKEYIKRYLKEKNIEVLDVGTHSEESVDYPDFAKKVCEEVRNGADFGILICGTGLGMSIAANKCRRIRAALCLYPDMARLARQHNNANVLVMAGRLMGKELAGWTVDAFLSAEFEGGRHERRIKKLEEIE
ncbi:MAG: ribose 5-phosphate isomerase B [Thermotogaceae bacterium]|nr:ribose 5-phosphate isomerase B [Thermotogaceae bacterium]